MIFSFAKFHKPFCALKDDGAHWREGDHGIVDLALQVVYHGRKAVARKEAKGKRKLAEKTWHAGFVVKRDTLQRGEVAKWQQKYRVDWDATDGRSGGAQQTVWEILLEMERFNGKAQEEDQGALVLGFGLDQGFRARQPPCGLGVGDSLQLHQEGLAGALRVFRTPEASAV